MTRVHVVVAKSIKIVMVVCKQKCELIRYNVEHSQLNVGVFSLNTSKNEKQR